MSDPTDSPDAKFEEANLRLDEGLISCRSVLVNYRALITGERPDANTDAVEGRDQAQTTETLGD